MATSHQAQANRTDMANDRLKRDAAFKVATVFVDLQKKKKLPGFNSPVDVVKSVNDIFDKDKAYITTREISNAVKNGRVNESPQQQVSEE